VVKGNGQTYMLKKDEVFVGFSVESSKYYVSGFGMNIGHVSQVEII
jgi:hypothetical protein